LLRRGRRIWRNRFVSYPPIAGLRFEERLSREGAETGIGGDRDENVAR
jgi:hypothetical protein